MRRPIVLLLAGLALLWSGTVASAQPAGQITCVADSEVPLLRGEQRAELVGEILLTCYGGDPTLVHFLDFEIFLNTGITSDLTDPLKGETEAMLLIDEPQPGVANISNGMGYVGQIRGTPGVSPGTGGGPGAPDSGNVYVGVRVTDSRVSFLGVPIVPAPPGATRTVRIANLRVDATRLAPGAGPSQTVRAFLATRGPNVILLGSGDIPVGRVENSLAVSVVDEGDTFHLRFQELFTSAFQKRIENTAAGELAVRQQGVPGTGHFTESGFTPDFAGLASDAPGVADTGTRLVARFHGVPPGMFVVAPANVGSRLGPNLGGEIEARRVVDFSPDFSGGTLLARDDPNDLVPLDGGLSTLVYEVVPMAPFDGINGSLDLDEFRIPVELVFGRFTSIDGVTVSLNYAPADPTVVMSGPAPEPRFFNLTPQNNLFEAEGRLTVVHETFQWFVGDPVPITLERTYEDPDPIIGGSIEVVTRTGGSWLTAVPADVPTTDTIRFAVNPTGLGPGTYVAGVTYRRLATDGLLRVVPVYLTVKPRPVLFLPLQQSANFEMFLGEPAPPPQSILVNARNRFVIFSVTAFTADGRNWLLISPNTGSTPANVNVSVDPAGLGAGTYEGALSVRSDAAVNSPLIVPVTLTIRQRVPVFEAAGVTNAASFLNGSVSPGEMVTFFGGVIGPDDAAGLVIANGRLATEVAGARILFNNVPAPIIATSSGQTTCIVPYSVAGMRGVSVVVEFQGARSEPVSLPVMSSRPGIFTSTLTGTGQAAVLNQDGSVNSAENAAEAGSVIVIYLTGGGQTSPAGDSGRINPLINPPRIMLAASARVGGFEATVEWIGGAPGQVAGVIQVNVRIDPRVAPGTAVPVEVTIGDGTSQPGVTIAVR